MKSLNGLALVVHSCLNICLQQCWDPVPVSVIGLQEDVCSAMSFM